MTIRKGVRDFLRSVCEICIYIMGYTVIIFAIWVIIKMIQYNVIK